MVKATKWHDGQADRRRINQTSSNARCNFVGVKARTAASKPVRSDGLRDRLSKRHEPRRFLSWPWANLLQSTGRIDSRIQRRNSIKNYVAREASIDSLLHHYDDAPTLPNSQPKSVLLVLTEDNLRQIRRPQPEIDQVMG